MTFFEAYTILEDLNILNQKYVLTEMIPNLTNIFTDAGFEEMLQVLNSLVNSERQCAIITCHIYSFMVSVKDGKLMIIDTHKVDKKCGGMENGLIKVYPDVSPNSMKAACNWLRNRMKTSRVKPGMAAQSLILFKPIQR